MRWMLGLILVGLAVSGEARADKIVWQSIAMACVPTSDTVDASNYLTTAGGVRHHAGETGLISFICAFDEARELSLRKSYRLRAHIKSVRNYPVPTQYMKAELRGRRHRDAHTFTILETVNHNGFTQNRAPQWMLWSDDEIIGWSDEITYYVQLTIRRDEARFAEGVEQIPAFFAVELIQN